jgi:DNA-binding LytR/AlgR family response regulator
VSRPIRAYLVDDESLALRRLRRLLEDSGRVAVVGSSASAHEARQALAREPVDVVFLDIEMPRTTGLELAERLPVPPWVVFVTAHDRYALRAFEVNALDYLRKPVARDDLARALDKIARVLALSPIEVDAEAAALLARIDAALQGVRSQGERIAAREGSRYVVLDLSRVTHFRADGKETLVVTEDGTSRFMDASLVELERRLGPGFVRVHRAFVVNLARVRELDARSAAGACVRLDDAARTELPVARDRLHEIKDRIGVR